MLAFVCLPSQAIAGIPVSETDSEIPYEYLGTIEVDVEPHLFVNKVVRVVSFGQLDKSKVAVIQKQLKKKLAKSAKTYSPDAVIKVEYSPTLEDPRFITSEKVFAKGDMVKYKQTYQY